MNVNDWTLITQIAAREAPRLDSKAGGESRTGNGSKITFQLIVTRFRRTAVDGAPRPAETGPLLDDIAMTEFDNTS